MNRWHSLGLLLLIVSVVGFYEGGAWWWTETPMLVAFVLAAGLLRKRKA